MKALALLAAVTLALAGCNRAPADKPQKAAEVNPSRAVVGSTADTELSTKVKSALTEAPDINMAGLQVASTDGVVTLYGTVDAPDEKDRAAMLALEVEGVRSVVNNLVVVKGS